MTAVPGNIVQIVVPTYHVDVVARDGNLRQFDSLIQAAEPIRGRLTTILRDGVDFTPDELFGHAICQELGDVDGRRTRQELAGRIAGLRGFVTRDLPENGGDLALTGDPGEGVVEYLGVGCGLVIADRLVGLDSSYFRRILERRGAGRKTLDFDGAFRASTGAVYIQLEAKGRTNADDEAAWRDIAAKKDAFRKGRAPRTPGTGPLPEGTPTYLIGTVAEIPRTGQGTTRVVVGDPPIPAFDGDPRRAKLLQRLRFYQRALSAIQPRGALLAALSERIGTLERPDVEWQKYDGRRLVNWRMDEWELAAEVAQTIRIRRDDQLHGRSVFPSRTKPRDGAEAEPRDVGTPAFFLLGIHRRVLLALARQDFEELSEGRYEIRYIEAEIDGAVRLLYQLPSGLAISSLREPSLTR